MQMFTLYCRSHLHVGFELLYMCAVLYIVKDCTE